MGFRIGHLEWPTNGHADAVLSVVMLRHGIRRATVTEADMQAAPQLTITTGDDDITFALDDLSDADRETLTRNAVHTAVQSGHVPSRWDMFAGGLIILVVLAVIGVLFTPLVVALWKWAWAL